MTASKLLLFLIILFLTQARNPSFSLNLTEQGITNIKTHVLPEAISKILSLPLPDISQSIPLFSVNVTNLTVKQLDLNASDIAIDLLNSKISVSVQHVAVQVEGDLTLVSLMITNQGTLHVDLSEITVTCSASVSLNDAKKFQVAISDININIGGFKLSIAGDVFIKFINMFIQLFQGIIQSQIQTQIQQALQTQVPGLLNQLLAGIPEDFKLPIPPVVPFSLHIEPTAAPNIQDSSIEVNFYGYIYDYFLNKTEPPIPEPVAFTPNPTQKQIQITISQYIVNSVFYGLQIADVMSYVFIQIPGTSYTVTTDYVDYFLPGLVEQYGANQMVIFFCSIPEAPELDFAHPLYDITLEVNVTCDIQPVIAYRPINVGKLALNLNVSLDVAINNGSLSVNFKNAVCQSLDIIDTNFTQKAHLDYLQDTINLGLEFGVKAIEPTLNIPIPSFQGIVLNDTELIFGEGFIRIETNPDLSNWTPSSNLFDNFYEGFTWVNFLEESTFRKFLEDNNSSFAFQDLN